MRALIRLAVACAGVAVWCGVAAAQPAASAKDTVKEQDGIRAELSVTESNVVLRWRFLKRLDTPLEEVTATVNGRPLGVPTIQPYPAPGQATAVIALLDVSGLDRQDQIERLKMAMLLLAARKAAHDQVAFAVYALESGLLVPPADAPDDMLRLLTQVPALDEIGNLSGALIASMRTLERIAAERRAIYVFTDGHNDSDIPLAGIADVARATGTAVTFLVVPSSRPADLPALAQLAQASGGQVVNENDIGSFLAEPFTQLDSGAQVRFPLDTARRLFWEGQSDLKVVMRYGATRLEFDSSAPVPAASLGETAAYVLEQHQVGVIGAMAALAAFAGLGFFAFGRRTKRSGATATVKTSAKAAPVTEAKAGAALEDIDSGTRYPLKTPLTRIGRSDDNDIVLQAATVGRFHAVVQQIGDRTYSITDQSSANGTLVNDQKIDTVTLSDGDTIALGAKRLRFKTA